MPGMQYLASTALEVPLLPTPAKDQIKMSFKRVFIWTCDFCPREERKDDYGLPAGWVFLKEMGPVRHKCPQCQTNAPLPMIAWYSNMQANLAGVVSYLTPDGTEVQCTEVRNDESTPKWADSRRIGPVVKYVRRECDGLRRPDISLPSEAESLASTQSEAPFGRLIDSVVPSANP